MKDVGKVHKITITPLDKGFYITLNHYDKPIKLYHSMAYEDTAGEVREKRFAMENPASIGETVERLLNAHQCILEDTSNE